jgi:membrane protease YdiL (CAAX protease family)
MPLRSVEFIVRVPLYAIPGIGGYIILSLVRPGVAIPIQFRVAGMVGGVALGLGCLAAGSTLAQGVFLVAASLFQRNRRQLDPLVDLVALADTGWLRGYTLARKYLPSAVFLLFTVIAITGEEVAFRGVSLPLLADGFGPIMGLVLTTLAFVGIQKMYMPSWHIALLPMTGALLMGIVLGYLALVQHDMIPLIIAHFSYFVLSISLFAAPRNPMQSRIKQF